MGQPVLNVSPRQQTGEALGQSGAGRCDRGFWDGLGPILSSLLSPLSKSCSAVEAPHS
jgi:hypothetical protein